MWSRLYVTKYISYIGILLFATSCGVGHIKEYKPKRRVFDKLEDTTIKSKPVELGTVFADKAPFSYLFTDTRAFHKHDIIRVHIQETAEGSNNAMTAVGSNGQLLFGTDFFEAIRRGGPEGIDPMRLLEVDSENRSRRTGETGREGYVSFVISATVKDVLSNGNIILEGESVVLVNNEEHHFYVSGIARPEDIQPDNSILSNQLAEAQIEFTGRGILAEGQKPGWLTRLWNWILNPL